MLVLAGEIHHLRHLGLGYLIGEYAAFTDAMMMHVEHDLGRSFRILVEEFLQDENHELHWSVIVVENEDTIKIRTLGLVLDLGDDRSHRAAGSAGTVFVAAHPGRRRIKSG